MANEIAADRSKTGPETGEEDAPRRIDIRDPASSRRRTRKTAETSVAVEKKPEIQVEEDPSAVAEKKPRATRTRKPAKKTTARSKAADPATDSVAPPETAEPETAEPETAEPETAEPEQTVSVEATAPSVESPVESPEPTVSAEVTAPPVESAGTVESAETPPAIESAPKKPKRASSAKSTTAKAKATTPKPKAATKTTRKKAAPAEPAIEEIPPVEQNLEPQVETPRVEETPAAIDETPQFEAVQTAATPAPIREPEPEPEPAPKPRPKRQRAVRKPPEPVGFLKPPETVEAEAAAQQIEPRPQPPSAPTPKLRPKPIAKATPKPRAKPEPEPEPELQPDPGLTTYAGYGAYEELRTDNRSQAIAGETSEALPSETKDQVAETVARKPAAESRTLEDVNASASVDAPRAAASTIDMSALTIGEPVPVKKRRRNGLTSLVGLLALGIGIAIGMVMGGQAGNTPERIVNGPSQVSSEAPVTSAAPPDGSPAAVPAPAPVDSSAEGVVAMRLSGSSSRQSALFDLPTGNVRVHYDSSGGSFTVRLLPQSGTDNGDTFMCTEPCDKDSTLIKEAGKYYLDVDAHDSDWNVRVSH